MHSIKEVEEEHWSHIHIWPLSRKK